MKHFLYFFLLNVRRNQISVVGAKALAENNILTTFDISFNQIGNEEKEALQAVLEHRQKEYEKQKIAFVRVFIISLV